MFRFIVKRNGQKVPFDSAKIVDAIFKALQASGEGDWSKAETLGAAVIQRLEAVHGKKKELPTVEDMQDAVESTLIENGFAKVAKAYILYRQHRAEVRTEKQQVLQKNDVDDVDKQFDTNALRVLASRYLRKDDTGKIIEDPKHLFIRVALHTTLASIFYDPKVFAKNSKKKGAHAPALWDAKLAAKKLAVGQYELNEFHKEALVRMYNTFDAQEKMTVSFAEFISMMGKGAFDAYEKEVTEYYSAMTSRTFLPNTPALANFGNVFGMGSACFVLGIDDSISSIMETLSSAATIFQSGGGVGYNFSHLRPEGDFVRTTGGVASGPLSFMRLYDTMTDVIKQGGIRRGANMGILNSNHPDILKFIKVKEGNKGLHNFNISVLLTEDFWDYYKSKKPYPLINPHTGKVVDYIDPRALFDALVYQAWESAEPGVIFADRSNEFNPFYKHLGPIETTNPCGEVLLYPNESCNLGSINVWSFVKHRNGSGPVFDWDGLAQTVVMATRFLDNVTDVSKYPLPEIEKMTRYTRKIGLGVMGVGDALYEMELPYNGKAGIDFMEQLMEFVNYHSKVTSIELAKKRGSLPAYKDSFYKDGILPFAGYADKKSWHFDWKKVSDDIKKYGIRNGYTTVIAPTGSISMIAGCSSGIEPVYSLVFEKRVAVGNFYYVDPVFEARMQREGLMGDDLLKDVSRSHGSVASLSYIPPKDKKTFVTAHDIMPKDHIHALAAFQKWVDSSISKTNNFPADATVDDVKNAYLLAYELGCKDVTVYRDGSIAGQVLVSGSQDDTAKKQKTKEKEPPLVSLKDEKTKGMGVYKEASANIQDGSLDMSPTLVSSQAVIEGGVKEDDRTEDGVDFNGAVKCKLCNL